MEKFKFTFIPVLVLTLCSFVFAGCEIDEDGRIKVDERGLTRVIRDLFPDDIFLQVDRLGMPVYGGNTPPDITGAFLSSPNVLVASNYDDSYAPGYKFQDMKVTYYEQNNRSLTVKVQQIQDDNVGSGMRGHIVGRGRDFTVFVVLDVLDEHGCQYKTGYIHSGTMSDGGIINLHRVII